MDLEDPILDEIADAPLAPRADLGVATIHRVCSRAARTAYGVAAEDALAKLTGYVRHMEPADPLTTTMDGWVRLGAVRGALDAWANVAYRPPRNAPSLEHAALYAAAWGMASGAVLAVEVERGVR